MPTSTHYSKSALKLRHELREWLSTMTPAADAAVSRYSVTLTFDINRMYALTESGELSRIKKLAWAKRAFAKFRLRLDRAILGNAASRYGRELEYIPLIEGQGAKQQLHYHCVIVMPSRVTTQEATAAVKMAWLSTGIGGYHIDVQPMYSDGWLNYISKEAWTVKRDAIDIENVRLKTCPQRC